MNTKAKIQQQILLVDDRPENLRVLRDILTKHGHMVRIAINGTLALISAKKSPPDLVLLDIKMPEMDGFEVCKQLKENDSTRVIPVIFLSASDDLEDKGRAFSAGGVDYINKPFQEADVLARVKTHLALREMQQQVERQIIESRRDEKRLSFLFELSQMKHLSQQEVVAYSLEQIVDLIQSRIAYIHFVDRENEKITHFAWSKDAVKKCSSTGDSHNPLETSGIWADCVREQKPVIHNDYQKMQRDHVLPKGHVPIERHMSVPVFDGGRICAIVGVGNKAENYDKSDVNQLTRFTGSMWEILQRRKIEDMNHRQNQYLTTLHQVSLGLLTHLEIKGLLQSILDNAAELAGVSQGFIHIYDPEKNDLEIQFAIGSFKKHIGFRIKPNEGLSGKVLQTGQSIYIDDYHIWEGRADNPDFDSIGSIVGIPLKSRNRIEGVIGLASAGKEEKLGKEEIRILELFAKLASVALDNAWLYSTMKQEIKERRQVEEELYKAKEAAENASRIKSEFLANMSHEIRTPMNSVLGFLSLVIENPALPEFLKKNLFTAQNSAKSLLTLINDILDVSKLESGRFDLENKAFYLPQLIKDTFKAFEVTCREKGLHLSWNIHPDLHPYYTGDSIRLRQIITNLAGNAVKFTRHGGVSLNISPADGEDMLLFSISDTGIGISPDKISSIFAPFTQADSSTSRRFGGTGLGTTISKQFAELMGGRIWAESEPGKGSIFHFTVRMKPADKPAEEDDESQVIACILPLRILLAEDIEANIMLAKIRLEQQKHKVIAARNGIEAVYEFEREKPDIILMDVQMPKMDGLEATRKIRELEAGSDNHTPVIALTASIMKEERELYMSAGMDAVVGKPVNFDELYKVMEKLVCKEQLTFNRKNLSEPLADNRSLSSVNCIDIAEGIQLWHNEKAYHKALLQFCGNYGNAGDEIRHLLKNGDRQGAFAIAHALKGVSGNLCITDVFRISDKLNEEIMKKERNEIIPLIDSLSHALEESVEFIQESILRQDNPLKAAGNNLLEKDISSLKIIFAEMLPLFEEYNPVLFEPFLEKLAVIIGSHQIEPIVQKLDRFDFDAAKIEIFRLAVSLNIDVEND